MVEVVSDSVVGNWHLYIVFPEILLPKVVKALKMVKGPFGMAEYSSFYPTELYPA